MIMDTVLDEFGYRWIVDETSRFSYIELENVGRVKISFRDGYLGLRCTDFKISPSSSAIILAGTLLADYGFYVAPDIHLTITKRVDELTELDLTKLLAAVATVLECLNVHR